LVAAVAISKAAAEPPHSKVFCANAKVLPFAKWTCGQRASGHQARFRTTGEAGGGPQRRHDENAVDATAGAEL
jgi:hypothetical protein